MVSGPYFVASTGGGLDKNFKIYQNKTMASIVPPTCRVQAGFIVVHSIRRFYLLFLKRRVPAKVPGVSLFYFPAYIISFPFCFCKVLKRPIDNFSIIPTSLVLYSINGL
jgi:hypothetical protein